MAQEAFRGHAARWLPVKRPEPYAGEVFRTLAGERGIALPAARIGRAPADARILATHRSRPLGEIVRYMLRFSTNITAEAIGTGATRHVGIAAGDLAESAGVMDAWAASVGPGLRSAIRGSGSPTIPGCRWPEGCRRAEWSIFLPR